MSRFIIEMEKIYEEIAKEYGVSVEAVKREMQEAIDAAYENTEQDIPTIEEFLYNEFLYNTLKEILSTKH